jgi:hypothetical protein
MDPIRVELAGQPVPVAVGQVMNPFEHVRIPDIIIEETAVGRLTHGTTFSLALEALPIPVLGDHAVVGARWIPDNSGMELRVTHVGTGRTAHVTFEVIRESRNHPAVIHLTDVYVLGTFLPSVRYGISINGQPLAANPTPANIFNNAIAQNTARGLSGRGNFDDIPYFIEVVRFEEFDPGAVAPPGTGVPIITHPPVQPPVPGVNRLTLRHGMPPFATNVQGEAQTVDAPFINHNFGQGYAVGMLNPRVFAHFLQQGGNLRDWNVDTSSGTLVVSFSGYDTNGQLVSVVLTHNSTTAVVNGNNVDIAAFAGNSGPQGSIDVIIVNDRTFVPLRFLANAFNLPIAWDAATATTTLG